MSIQALPVYELPFLYINGLNVSNNATTPNTKLDVAAGQCRDSTDSIDMVFSSAITINAAVNGYNGLDTGSLGASHVYAVYGIADSAGFNPVGCMLSLASNSSPLLPFGYDSYRLIGYAVTDSSSHFLLAYVSGNNNYRMFIYDVPIATAVTAGNSATYAAVTLTNFVPNVQNTPVLIETNWTANAAADTLALQPFGASGDTVKYIAPVAGATAHTLVREYVQARLDSGAPKINYKVSAGTVAINVAGFEFFI